MSRLWNAYQDAVATFAAAGRLVEYDESGAVVSVNGEERLLEPATLVTAAMMMAKSGVALASAPQAQVAPAPPQVRASGYTGHSNRGIERVIDGEAGDELDPELAEKLAELERAREKARLICATHAHLLGYEIVAGYEVTECQHCALEGARVVCETHAYQLTGWEEAWCPLCAAEDPASVTGSTTSGHPDETQEQERRHIMSHRDADLTFHDCPVLDRKSLFAGPDGYCRHCRSVELAAQILDREEVTGPTFAELLEQVGGEAAYRASLEDIRHAKHHGRPGNAVAGRKPRELLNLILTQRPMVIGGLLEAYRAFAGKYGIALRHDPDGVVFHDYAVFAPVQPTLPELAPALRDYTWQVNVAEKRAMRNAFVESVRTSRRIVMSWVSSDGTESGAVTLGPNTEETRLVAAEYQAAARKKGFQTRFSLVQG